MCVYRRLIGWLLLTASIAINASSQSGVRIDAGAMTGHVDVNGNSWEPDRSFTGGTSVDRGSISIANTSDPALCRTERYGMQAYSIAVPNGPYLARLVFCETYWTARGQRVFDVSVNGQWM